MIFLFATELEAQHFRAASPHATIVICGVGAAECAATTADIISKFPKEHLVLAGIAGSYSLSTVGLCEVVEVIETQIEALPERFSASYRTTLLTTLRKVRSNSVNCSSEVGSTLSEIEEMEGATFSAVCNRFGVQHSHIRAISNLVGDPFANWRINEACWALAQGLLSLTASGGWG